MAFELPKSRVAIRQIQTQKRNVPLEQILAVEGQSPVAAGIDVAGQVIGQSLQRRAELRRQGEQLARLEQAYGLQSGELSGIGDTGDALRVAENMQSRRTPTFVQQINPDGSATLLEVPAGGKFGGTVKAPGIPSLPKGMIPKEKGSTPAGAAVVYDPAKQSYVSQGKEYTGTILPSTVGTEEQRREALVVGAQKSIADVRDIITTNPSTLNELKAIRLTPGRVYAQLASPDAKRLYINLREAISNEIYLKTGATANEQELENATISYLAALNDSPSDFLGRMELLDRNISPFNARGGLPTLEKPKPKGIPVLTGKKKSVAEKLGL